MPIAQVVGRTNQIIRRAMGRAVGNAKYRLVSGYDANERTVFSHHHIAATHHHTALQKHTKLPTTGVGAVKSAFLPNIPIEFYRVGAFD